MQVIPLIPEASQSLDVNLAGQSCRIEIYQKSVGLLLDLSVGDRYVVVGQICRDRCRLIRLQYLGFIGDLAFFDTQGANDPESSGLGSRWKLIYLPG